MFADTASFKSRSILYWILKTDAFLSVNVAACFVDMTRRRLPALASFPRSRDRTGEPRPDALI